ncbi:MAG: extracellular solute-binding protein [Treponema sp.]|nr:extracellular solute-binding protein [Treponema sp.]
MKKEIKRKVENAATSVLCAGLLLLAAGCGGKKASKQTDFKILSGMSALSNGYDDNKVLKDMAAKAGINIKWESLSDSVNEQVNIRIAGNELPDAFQGINFTNYNLSNYGGDGTFIDLTPYITDECMPNLSKILKDHPEIKSAITMADGKIYGLPSGEQMGTVAIGAKENHSIFTVPQFSMINKAWLDALGLKVPETLDELHDCLLAFKENDMSHKYYKNAAGSTIPMSTGFDQWCWGQNVFYAGFGFTNWINDIISDIVLTESGKVDFVSTRDDYRKAMDYFHKWYAEGLMDPSMFSQDATQLISKCSSGYVGVSTWWYIEELMGDYAKDYVFLPILKGPDGDYNVTVRTGGGISSGNLSITKACKDPASLLKFYDLWYESENTMQLQYGPIDVFFTGKDSDGLWLSITEDEAKQKFGKSAGEVKASYEVMGPKLILADYYKTTFKMEDRAIERLTDLENFWMPYVKNDITYPVDCVYTEDELEIIDTYKTDFENTVSEYEGTWIKNGGPTDAQWKEYISLLENGCGLNKLKGVYQAAYDRYLKNIK